MANPPRQWVVATSSGPVQVNETNTSRVFTLAPGVTITTVAGATTQASTLLTLGVG